MYDGLTPLFDQVSDSDLDTYFKSEGFGVGPDGPATIEPVPRPGVTIERDRFNVPHVTGADPRRRHLGRRLDRRRGPRPAAASRRATTPASRRSTSPGVTAISLITGPALVHPQRRRPRPRSPSRARCSSTPGKEGRAVLHDIDVFISGDQRLHRRREGSTDEPWTRNDVFALNALKGQFLGQGGGDEARRSAVPGRPPAAARRASKGANVFNDLRQFKNPELPTSIDGRFPYGKIPKHATGSVVVDPGSYEPVRGQPEPAPGSATEPMQASNTLMITKRALDDRTGR